MHRLCSGKVCGELEKSGRAPPDTLPTHVTTHVTRTRSRQVKDAPHSSANATEVSTRARRSTAQLTAATRSALPSRCAPPKIAHNEHADTYDEVADLGLRAQWEADEMGAMCDTGCSIAPDRAEHRGWACGQHRRPATHQSSTALDHRIGMVEMEERSRWLRRSARRCGWHGCTRP